MKYELMFMTKPTLTEDEVKKNIEYVRGSVKGVEGVIIKEDFWGKRKLAYEIKRMQEAYYTVLDLDLSQSQVKKIASSLSSNGDIFRYLITKKD